VSTVSLFHHSSQWICDLPRAGAAEKGHTDVLATSFAQARPRPELTGQIASLWLERGGGAWRRSRVLPDGFVDLIWGNRLWVRGPDTRNHPVRYPSDATFVGIRFHPGAAAPLLGVPASELVDRRVYLTDLWGRAAVTLEEGLAATQSVSGVMRALQDAVWERAAGSGQPDAIVTAVVAATAERSSPTDIRGLARRLNVSERQLRRRCCAALGYGPKTLDRILRLQRVLALARRQPTLTIGVLATRAGYADHAHLARECRRLSGETPRTLLGR
jgi:AraC-like DNA-binding protein